MEKDKSEMETRLFRGKDRGAIDSAELQTSVVCLSVLCNIPNSSWLGHMKTMALVFAAAAILVAKRKKKKNPQ